MPAREETFRSQTRLHVVFAISSIAMMLTIVWMIMADHLRPWKETQREFHFIEDAKLRVEEQKRQDELNKTQLDELAKRIEAADQTAEENSKQIRAQENDLKKIGGKFEQLDTATRFLKAELDSQRSEYDLKIDLNQNREAKNYLNDVIVPSEKRLLELRREFGNILGGQAKRPFLFLRSHDDLHWVSGFLYGHSADVGVYSGDGELAKEGAA